MAYFAWKPEYSVKIAAIDTQHKKLVDMINTLYDAMKAGKSKEVIDPLLNALVDYTKTHFTDEEKLMQVNGYPGLVAHLGEHTRLMKQVLEYQQQWRAGKLIAIDLSQFLKDWLTNHIAGVDMKYSPYLVSKGVK
jgi:hemerythrin